MLAHRCSATPAAYRAGPRKPDAALPSVVWWRGFRSKELTDLVEESLTSNGAFRVIVSPNVWCAPAGMSTAALAVPVTAFVRVSVVLKTTSAKTAVLNVMRTFVAVVVPVLGPGKRTVTTPPDIRVRHGRL